MITNVRKGDKLRNELLGTDTLLNQILLEYLNNIEDVPPRARIRFVDAGADTISN